MTNEKPGSRRWIVDALNELDEQNPTTAHRDQDWSVSDQGHQLAQVAFQKATEVLGHANELHAKAGSRKQRAVEILTETGDDEEFCHAEEAEWESKVLVDQASEHREQALINYSEPLGRAAAARKQAKAELDAQYSAGMAPIPDQAHEALTQADRDFHRIRSQVLGEIALALGLTPPPPTPPPAKQSQSAARRRVRPGLASRARGGLW